MSNDVYALPTPEESLDEARRRLARTFSKDELIWVVDERYDAAHTIWHLDVVRQGAQGRWVRQRHRYDAQANVLYFLGERALSDEEFRQARRGGRPFDVAVWQRKG